LFVVVALSRGPWAEAKPPAATAAFGITQVDLPADKVQAIEQAAPDRAPAKPAKPRKVLVYGRVPTHPKSVPFCFKAFEILGKKTGAFETVSTGDPAVFLPENLRQFDAVVMNCTHEFRPFLPPELLQWPKYKDKDLDKAEQAALWEKEAACQKNLLEFVRSGKGLVGIHGANCMVQWPQYMEMIGGQYAAHFVDTVWIKTDEPGHPLCAAMKDKCFEIREEIYGFGPPVFSREKVRVLLDLDLSKSPDPKKRPNKDYAVSWVHLYGQGRVFYCSLGHFGDVYVNPNVLAHYLAGLQFAIGDLKAECTPRVSHEAARP
jgi:type 1 glutamine amidotransferase